MALLQSLTTVPRTLGDLAESVFRLATTTFTTHGPRVDFVCDQYPDVSIKGSGLRAKSSGSLVVNITHPTQSVLRSGRIFFLWVKTKNHLSHFFFKSGRAMSRSMPPVCSRDSYLSQKVLHVHCSVVLMGLLLLRYSL